MDLSGIEFHNLFGIGLSWSDDSSREFERLTRVNLI